QSCVLDGGAGSLQRQFCSWDARAAPDTRYAEATDDGVLLEVAHPATVHSYIYFCNDSRLDCTFLVMPDEAPPAFPARMLPKLHQHIGAFGPGAAGGRLMVGGSTQCDWGVGPPAADCPNCGGALVARPVSGRGTVFTYTVNYQ